MRLVPALLLLRVLYLPTTAVTKGGHGGSKYASRRHAAHHHLFSPVARDVHGLVKRDPENLHRNRRHSTPGYHTPSSAGLDHKSA